MFRKITAVGGVLLGVLTISTAIVVAQDKPQPQTTAPGVEQRDRGDRMRRRNKRRHMQRGERGALRGLELTDQQKEQAKAIMRANFDGNKAQREELRQLLGKRREGSLSEADQSRAKELRRQLHESRKNARTQVTGLLTPEQKMKIEERKKNRQENRRRFGRRDQTNKPT